MKIKYILVICILLFSSFSLSSVLSTGIKPKSIIIDDNYINNLSNSIFPSMKKVDKNQNKIADYLEEKNGNLDLIVLFDDFSSIPSYLDFGSIISKYSSIPAVHMNINSAFLPSLRKLPGIQIIEGNKQLKSQLAYSTNQMDVRDSLWAAGYTGTTDYSVAILDTGIDYTHNAFKGRILATYNAADDNATKAIDYDGHGTHVAGIIAGQYPNMDSYSKTIRGTLPTEDYHTLDFSIPNLASTQDITIGVDWGTKGRDYPGSTVGIVVYHPDTNTVIDDTPPTSSSGLLETTVTLQPGDYVVGFYNKNGAENQPYEGWVDMPLDSAIPTYSNPDSFPANTGVASKANIVAVKVLDDKGYGSVANFLAGVDWVIKNKLKYKIVVVNLSLGLEDTIHFTLDDAMRRLVDQGILPVVAAGNSGSLSNGIYSPGSAADALTVGAVNKANEIAYYSSIGSAYSNGEIMKPDVVAPGGSFSAQFMGSETSYKEGPGVIYSADSNFVGFNSKPNDMIGYQGTSMAAPHIAGLADLLIQKMSEKNPWSWSRSDVLRVKQAILAGTFEVANIGYDGGEKSFEEPDPTPTLNRNSRDFVEGWGAVSAEAAMNALATETKFGYWEVDFDQQDPFGIKVETTTLFAVANKEYKFSVDVPNGADVDLLVFDTSESTTTSHGDLDLLFSSTSASKIDATNDESINIKVSTTKELILVVRMVDSLNSKDTVGIKLIDPLFEPMVEILHPLNGTYTNVDSVKLEFNSITNDADVFLNGSSVGKKASGDLINIPAEEGIYNLTVVETNINIPKSATQSVFFTIDRTAPSFEATTIPISADDKFIIKMNMTDNNLLSEMQVLIDNKLFDAVPISTNQINFEYTFDVFRVVPGTHNISMQLIDRAGNADITVPVSITLNHTTYLIVDQIQIVEYKPSIILFWATGTTVTPEAYSISINSSIIKSGTWNGSNLAINLDNYNLGVYNFSITVQSNTTLLNYQSIITIEDTIAPSINGPDSGYYDANNELEVVFTIQEYLPEYLKITIDDEVFREYPSWDGITGLSFNISGQNGETTTIVVLANDTSGNSQSYELAIYWIDFIIPEFTSVPSTMSFDEGHAKFSVIWRFSDNKLADVSFYVNNDLIESITSNIGGYYEVGLDYLNNLSVGIYVFELYVTDVGGNSIHHSVLINVFEANENGSENGFLYAPINILATILILTSVMIFKKRKRIFS